MITATRARACSARCLRASGVSAGLAAATCADAPHGSAPLGPAGGPSCVLPLQAQPTTTSATSVRIMASPGRCYPIYSEGVTEALRPTTFDDLVRAVARVDPARGVVGAGRGEAGGRAGR